MTEIAKGLKNEDGRVVAEVRATIVNRDDAMHIELALRGVVLGAQAGELREYLQNLACFPAQTWELDLGGLQAISLRALRVLVVLTRVLSRREARLEIVRINPAVNSSLRAMHLQKYFKRTRTAPASAPKAAVSP